MIHVSKACTTIDKESIPFFRMATLLSGLKLECRGLKFSRGSCYAMIKREFGLKGNKQKVLEQFEPLVQAASAKEKRVIEK